MTKYCVIFLFFLVGCAGPLQNKVAGNAQNIFSTSEIIKYKNNQDQYLSYFKALAFSEVKDVEEYIKNEEINNSTKIQTTIKIKPELERIKARETVSGDPTWTGIARAGWAFIDVKCADYLRELYSNKKRLSGLRKLSSSVGATTASVLGITSSAAQAIAITGAAFGLAGNLFDISGETFLTSLDYNTITQLVARTQLLYRGLYEQAGIHSRVAAVSAIQGYLYICEPSSIEANVNSQVQHSGDTVQFLVNSGFVPVSGDEVKIADRKNILEKIIKGTD